MPVRISIVPSLAFNQAIWSMPVIRIGSAETITTSNMIPLCW